MADSQKSKEVHSNRATVSKLSSTEDARLQARMREYLWKWAAFLSNLPNGPDTPKQALGDNFKQEIMNPPPSPDHPPTVADITKLNSSASQPVGKKKKRRPKTFHKFALLPYDIRLMIWDLSNIPRIHHVSYEREVSDSVHNLVLDRAQDYGTWRYLSPRPPLPNRSICRESRSEFWKAHSLLQFDHDARRKVFFNYRIDTLFYDTDTCPYRQPVLPPLYKPWSAAYRVVNIAVSLQLLQNWDGFDNPYCHHCYWRDDPWGSFFKPLGDAMCRLKTFKLVKNGILLSGNQELYFVKARSPSPLKSLDALNSPWSGFREFFCDGVEFERVLVKEK